MAKTLPTNISDVVAAPLGDLIAAVGRGLAEAQQSLDLSTAETVKRLYAGDDQKLEFLRRLGYQPTWYRIPELSAELTVSLGITGQSTEVGTSQGRAANGLQLFVAPLNADYSNRYDYDLEAASVVKFRIVPVPPTAQAAELKVVPKLAGLSYQEATRRLAQLGIPFEPPSPLPALGEPAWIATTRPDAGELIASDEQVRLTLSLPRSG